MDIFTLVCSDIISAKVGNIADYLRSLGAIVVLTLASLSPDLRHLVPDIEELQDVAINNIRPWAFSSLEAVVSILEDIRRKQRILSSV